MTPANDELKTAVEAMYRLALEGCQTYDECMRVRNDVFALMHRLQEIVGSACLTRIIEIEKGNERT